VNRKNINTILKILLPVSSTVIGPPRKTAAMSSYLKDNPASGSFGFYNESHHSTDDANLPLFFSGHTPVLQNPEFIARLYGGRVWGANGAVIGAGDYFIGDVSREFNKGLNIKHSVYYTLKQVKARRLKGVTAVIGTAGANVYYHWMLDVLPRLGLVSKMNSLDAVDNFITGFTGLPFQQETLEKIGIPPQKVVASNNNWNFHIKAESLLVPSLAGSLDQPNLLQVNFLRNLYKDCFSNKPPFRKLYISRKKVGRREIVNEAALTDCLSSHNFEIIYCEQMKVAEQVYLFSEASIIICSHGSALTNLVFCKPTTIVIDIFNASHINPCFWFISRMLDLEYHFISGESKSMDSNPKNDHTIVDIMLFKKTLQTIGLE
jgi:capsular polysaccharide biosynthesis protein